MNSSARSRFFSARAVGASLGFALCLFLAQQTQAQNLTINFRFDGQSGAAATTQTLDSALPGQNFTVDVWASITGSPTPSNLGLVTLRFRGLSSTTDHSAFATGAGIGVTSFTMLSPFNATANSPTIGDVGSASAYATTSVTLDGLSDFGGTAATTAAVANSNNGVTPISGGNASAVSEAVANGWEFMVGQFVIHTGAPSSVAGSRTSYLPVTGLGAAASKQSYTVDGGTTFLHGDWTSGTGITLVAPSGGVNGTTIAVIPGPNASVLKGGIVGLAASINNTGSTALAPGDYTFSASGGSGISYTAMPSVPIPAPGTANFSTIASTSPGPGGTPIGNATVTFTVPATAAITNSPQSASLTLNVGGATADNTNQAGVYGAALTAPVGPGGSYAGLESAVVGVQGAGGSPAQGPGPGFLGGRAVILAGGNSSAAGRTVAMQWRTRLVGSVSSGQLSETHGGAGSALQVTTSTTGLVSDVVNLTGLEIAGNNTDSFVLDMSYNPTLLPKGGPPAIEASLANNKLIYMVSPAPGPDNGLSQYVNTVALNTGNAVLSPLDPRYGFQGPYSAFVGAFGNNLGANMGAWGVDIGTHEVWAVLNHNSTFAVVPEPGTILLAGLGLLGIVGLRRRMKK